MSPDKELAVRFAVGDPDGPRSAVWRVWANPGSSDVYVAARVLGGVAKVSLHQSGRWRFAFTKEYSERENSLAPSEGDRVMEKWDRPPEVADGITPAFMVSVPSAEATEPKVRLPEADRKLMSKVVWVPPATAGSATHFIVYLTEPEMSPPDDDRFIFRARLPSGETVSVMVLEQLITQDDEKLVAQHKEAIARAMREAGGKLQEAIEAAREPRGWLYGHNEYGTRFFIDISGIYLRS